jgi:hypothetical protein
MRGFSRRTPDLKETNMKRPTPNLLTSDQQRQLLANGKFNAYAPEYGDRPNVDFKPVVKLFCPWGGATWLLTELDPEDNDIAFGLCDLGMGCPELGTVRLSELESIRGPDGLRIERDLYFKPNKTISAYADEASRPAHRRLNHFHHQQPLSEQPK